MQPSSVRCRDSPACFSHPAPCANHHHPDNDDDDDYAHEDDDDDDYDAFVGNEDDNEYMLIMMMTMNMLQQSEFRMLMPDNLFRAAAAPHSQCGPSSLVMITMTLANWKTHILANQ